MEPHHYRALPAVIDARRPYIQVLAVVVHVVPAGNGAGSLLGRNGAVVKGHPHALPGLHLMGLRKPLVRLGIGDAVVGINPIAYISLHLSGLGVRHRDVRACFHGGAVCRRRLLFLCLAGAVFFRLRGGRLLTAFRAFRLSAFCSCIRFRRRRLRRGGVRAASAAACQSRSHGSCKHYSHPLFSHGFPSPLFVPVPGMHRDCCKNTFPADAPYLRSASSVYKCIIKNLSRKENFRLF